LGAATLGNDDPDSKHALDENAANGVTDARRKELIDLKRVPTIS
jgi:hypothetical protein